MFLFLKVANNQRPAADSELTIACLINLDMINISIEGYKLVLNEIKRSVWCYRPICGEIPKCHFSDCKPKVECVVVGLCGLGLLF